MGRKIQPHRIAQMSMSVPVFVSLTHAIDRGHVCIVIDFLVATNSLFLCFLFSSVQFLVWFVHISEHTRVLRCVVYVFCLCVASSCTYSVYVMRHADLFVPDCLCCLPVGHSDANNL